MPRRGTLPRTDARTSDRGCATSSTRCGAAAGRTPWPARRCASAMVSNRDVGHRTAVVVLHDVVHVGWCRLHRHVVTEVDRLRRRWWPLDGYVDEPVPRAGPDVLDSSGRLHVDARRGD